MRKKINAIEGKRNLLAHFLDDIKLLVAITKDYFTGRYKKIPYWIICTILFTLLYVFNPLDVIPDFIPGVGQFDDAAVVMICLRLSEEELRKHNMRKRTRSQKTDVN